MARRRLRSSTVVLGGMGVLAVTLSACGSEPDRRCVNPTTMETLPSYECGSSTGTGRHYYGGNFATPGSKLENGSFSKSAVERGGLGCSSSGSGGG
ncbi:hypothetical protein ACFVIM_10125 [Streptomyces sp. NPDC057638]|uniref:hypothetical protein n=1 Tax=Streptomyces sp. NPDC057638 TaxID=3346190 RepID=UPI0036D18E97